MSKKKGFTVLELVFAIIFVGIFVVLFFMQKVNADAMDRDEKRKVAIKKSAQKGGFLIIVAFAVFFILVYEMRDDFYLVIRGIEKTEGIGRFLANSRHTKDTNLEKVIK